MITLKLYLVRHGKDTPNVRGGWSSEPLTEAGMNEVVALGEQLKGTHFDDVLSSDLMRAKQTTELLVSHMNWLGNVTYDERLREVNNGQLAGMPNDIAERLFPGLYWNTLEWNQQYPDGESPKAFFERISRFLDEIKTHYNENDVLLMITHHGVIEVILSRVNKVEYSNKVKNFRIPTGSVSVVEL